MSDIVERLRDLELSDTFNDRNWETMAEAADEIERLRDALNRDRAADHRPKTPSPLGRRGHGDN